MHVNARLFHKMVTCKSRVASQEVEVALYGRLCLYVECVLADFVRVLARSRNFDTSTPVEVEVAKLICQVLQDCTVKVRCVVANEEMGGQNATLSGSLTDQEEVIKISSFVTNKVAINNRTTWWVFDWKIRRFNLCISNT